MVLQLGVPLEDDHGSGGRSMMLIHQLITTATGSSATAGGGRIPRHLLLAAGGEDEPTRNGHDDDHIVEAHPGHVHQVDGEDFVADDDAFTAVHRRLQGNPAEKITKER